MDCLPIDVVLVIFDYLELKDILNYMIIDKKTCYFYKYHGTSDLVRQLGCYVVSRIMSYITQRRLDKTSQILKITAQMIEDIKSSMLDWTKYQDNYSDN